MKDQVMQEEQLELFSGEAQAEPLGDVDTVSGKMAASNASEWGAHAYSPFFQSIAVDGDGPKIVNNLRSCTDSMNRRARIHK